MIGLSIFLLKNYVLGILFIFHKQETSTYLYVFVKGNIWNNSNNNNDNNNNNNNNNDNNNSNNNTNSNNNNNILNTYQSVKNK